MIIDILSMCITKRRIIERVREGKTIIIETTILCTEVWLNYVESLDGENAIFNLER